MKHFAEEIVHCKILSFFAGKVGVFGKWKTYFSFIEAQPTTVFGNSLTSLTIVKYCAE